MPLRRSVAVSTLMFAVATVWTAVAMMFATASADFAAEAHEVTPAPVPAAIR